MQKVLTAEEWQKLPWDDRVDYICVRGQGWVYQPTRVVLAHDGLANVSLEKRRKFRWVPARQRYVRMAL